MNKHKREKLTKICKNRREKSDKTYGELSECRDLFDRIRRTPWHVLIKGSV